MALPFISVTINGLAVKTLIDSGCQQSVVSSRVVKTLGLRMQGHQRTVRMLNGNTTQCSGEVVVTVKLSSGSTVQVTCLVAPELVCGCGLILGVDGIYKLGGVTISSSDNVQFGCKANPIAAACQGSATPNSCLNIEDSDFNARFDGTKWSVAWRWKGGEAPVLRNQCAEYAVNDEHRPLYQAEIDQWIDSGWLVPHEHSLHGSVSGVIPLMAVFQPNKSRKIRPVMDYSREVNKHVHSNPGTDVAICQEKLREWRKMGDNTCMLDLQKAYLQLHVDTNLQRFQAVRLNGKLYVMTRMGFGLNVAPKIMSRILTQVLSLDDNIRQGTDHYIDDIIVNEDIVSVVKVKEHLVKYGLLSKEPERLSSARVLGLRVEASDKDILVWGRDCELPKVESDVTKRGLYSICGKYIGHYPVARWLRVACSFMKREVNSEEWDSNIPSRVKKMLDEVSQRVQQHDPVSGEWKVSASQTGKVWCDASSLAIGVCLEIDNHTVEDASWLRDINDGAHINLAELDGVVKAVNMALKWNLKNVTILSDSATVCGWIRSVLTDSKRPKVSGLSEMLVKRRLNLVKDLITEYELEMQISLVKTSENKADELTRVPRKWLNERTCSVNALVPDIIDNLRTLHDTHHLGVDRTLHLAQGRWGSAVCRKDVLQIIEACQVCKRVDPAPVHWEPGHIDVVDDWHRLATDITHYNGNPYLTVIDCGPSRYAVWRKLKNETSAAVMEQLEHIFSERGSPVELLSDNGPCFRALKPLLQRWNVCQLFSSAYRASCNGIIERNHRTIKRMLARSGGSVNDMLYWYNNSPNAKGIVPFNKLFSYTPQRLEGTGSVGRDTNLNPYRVGDQVYVKPGDVKCTTVWKTGTVTSLVSNTTVKVDRMTRHIGDIRFCWRPELPEKVHNVEVILNDIHEPPANTETDIDDSTQAVEPSRPVRNRKTPDFYIAGLD